MAQEAWLQAAAQGDFSGMPGGLSFGASAGLAHLVDGYSIAGGLEGAARLARETLDARVNTGVWPGTTLDLWVTLFFLHRASRHGGTDEEDTDNPMFNELCATLSAKLQALSDVERAPILQALTRAQRAM
jgi:hypothetical protein